MQLTSLAAPFSSKAKVFGLATLLTYLQRALDYFGGDSARLVLLCLAWYLSSAVANNVGKQLLNIFRYPVTVSWVQFGFIAIYGAIAAKGLGLTQLQGLTPKVLRTVVPLCGFQIGSQVLTSIATSRVPVSSVHTVKALSPLFTVVVYGTLYGARYSPRVYFSLVPLTLGVMFACSAELQLQLVGLLCALGSCIVYVAQNVFSKRVLFRDTGDGVGNAKPRMDKLNMLFWSACSAFVCLAPGWFYSEGARLLFQYGEINGRQYDAAVNTAPWSQIAYYMFLNATAHFIQALLAINVLASCSTVSYSIASLMKRVAVITAAVLWFQQPVSSVQGFGILLTFLGLWLYDRAKLDVKSSEHQAQRTGDQRMQLPWTIKQV
ncbi:triose-phosphate transporter family-domain-containing protein [Thamnocephalis sphaerospora]|uniref:Triose-phosphate transporter family-domain-containing protein n=1 Tax=Thamnocephalis sphaerospora TaxID=78915 RepID=A0A4P9XTW3_9FUNG|nr:triose-phosphate transporter family-domain-containing protein [Thamnocephalis sphaerospora]|eukprot:RKP09606.1 triose-phosphate transporter family-domain-containing protein [Thamnocephalis sphaerospora]